MAEHAREIALEEMGTSLECSHGMIGEDPRFLGPKSKPQYTPHKTFVPTRIRLDLSVDLKTKLTQGSCTTTFDLIESREWIEFDAVKLNVTRVDLDGKKVKYTYEDQKIRVPVSPKAKKGKVTIHYSVKDPPLGIYFVHPTKDRPDKPVQAWSHCEPQDARYWYPCQDWPENKCPIEMHITVEQPYMVVSNGHLVSTKTNKGKTTYSWVHDFPNPTYLNSFAIGDFAVVKDKWKHVPVEYYCEKGREEEIKRAFGKTPQMIEVFSNYLRYPYPYKKYAQVAVADFIFGGMEHTTCTTQTDLVLQDEVAHAETPARPQILASHELAHQWFGDLLTCKDWAHLWLNEGFATYFEYVWWEHILGTDDRDYFWYLDTLTYMDEDKNHYRRPIVTNMYQEPNELTDRHTYERGGLFLHLLRHILGDEAFRNGLAHYVNKHAHGVVETQDLITAFREATGKNVAKYFDQWVYGTGFPEFKVSTYYDAKTKNVIVRVIQTNRMDEKNLFEMPVIITVTEPSGKEVEHRVGICKREHRFKLPAKGMPLNVVFDTPNVVLKSLIMQKPREMWLHQLRHDSHAIQRIFAAQELAKVPSMEEFNAILERVQKDSKWFVRAECALSLRTTTLPEIAQRLMKLFPQEKEHRVQRAILETLSFYRTDAVQQFLEKQSGRMDSHVVPAEAFRGMGKWKDNLDITKLSKGIQRKSWMDLVAMGAISGITAIQSETALHKLIEFTHPKYSNNIRIAAANGIAQASGRREKAIQTLLTLADDPYTNVQLAAVQGLGIVGDDRVIEKLQKLTEGDRDGRVRRSAFDAIRTINGGIDLPPYGETEKNKEAIPTSPGRDKQLARAAGNGKTKLQLTRRRM